MPPPAAPWNARATRWQWEVNLIRSEQINAFCMPGGKIAFYTGILDKLRANPLNYLLVPVFLGVTMGSTDEVGAMLGKKLNKFQSSLEGQIAAPTGSSHFMGNAPGGTSGAKWIEVPSAGSVSDRIMAVVAG